MKNLVYLLLWILFAALPAPAQEPLEKPAGAQTAPAADAPGTPAPRPPTAPLLEKTPGAPPTSAPLPMPDPGTEPPPPQNFIGLLILAVILAHVCLPLSLIVCIVVLLIGIRIFKGGLTKLLMGIAAAGGAKGLKGILTVIGCIIVLPAGFLGLNWAVGWMDYRLSDPSWWLYGLLVSVITGFVFFSLMKALATALKKRMMGKMGAGMMANMMGQGMKQVGGKKRRR